MFDHEARILHRFPRHLQQQALLRIEIAGLARRYGEERGFELVDSLAQETAGPHIHLTRGFGMRIVKLIHVPSVFRDFDDGIRAVLQQIPKGSWTVSSSRKATTNADDSNG